MIPTPHGRARMGERAVSVKELQTAKKYGTVTRARNGRDGAVRWKIEHNGIVYITDRTQKLVITTYHQSPEEPEAKDARVRELVRQVRELSAERSEATNRLETAVAMLFIEHREEERRLEERLDALESELEDARGPRVQAAVRATRRRSLCGAAAAPPRAKKNSGPVAPKCRRLPRFPQPQRRGWHQAPSSEDFSANEARNTREAAEPAAAAKIGKPPPPPTVPHPYIGLLGRGQRCGTTSAARGRARSSGTYRSRRRRRQDRPTRRRATSGFAELAEVAFRHEPARADILRRQGVTAVGARVSPSHAGGRGARSSRRSRDLDQNRSA